MKRFMISGFAAVALLAVAATMLRSHSLSSAPAIKTAAQEFEDMSLVFSAPPKR